jgi:hypothetical protein
MRQSHLTYNFNGDDLPKLAICEECMGIFIKTEGRQKFCPPNKVDKEIYNLKKKLGRVRGKLVSHCATLNRQKRYREREKLNV